MTTSGLGSALALWAAVTLTIGARGLDAQNTSEDTLTAVEVALDSGHVESARETLERWFEAHEGRVGRVQLARARFLRARLTQDADSSEVEYLRVAIDGGSPYGALAWLRLAQLHLARSDPERARRDLQRLRAEYPNSPQEAESWLWTGHALEAVGDLPEACRAWERAARERGGAGEGAVARRIRGAREQCDSPGLRFTVQIGAFSTSTAARSLSERALRAGFEARVQRLEDGLWRVRVGRFSSVDSAREMADRLREGNFSAAIMSEEP